MKVEYNVILDEIIERFNDRFADPYYYDISLGAVTFGRKEPQPEDYGRAFVKMDYGDKMDETGKYGTTPAMEVNWSIQMIICCNESHIDDSKRQAWEVLSEIEEFIRSDVKLGGIEYLMRAIPGDARGEIFAGTEYRLTLELLTRWQIH